MAQVKLKNVHKVYDGVSAIRDCNLTVEDKEWMMIAGPTGCGKSSLLKAIAGFEEIDQGEIYIGGALVNGLTPPEREIAALLQNNALYPSLTVFENLAFGITGKKAAGEALQSRIRRVAETLQLTELLERKAQDLSPEERHLVSIGRVLVREPKVVLLDEPLANLERSLQLSQREFLARLQKQLGITFIYVTQDPSEAVAMGDRLAVMKEGVIQQVGTPETLRERPVNRFVAGFLSVPQMNFLDGVLERESSGYALTLETCRMALPLQDGDEKLASYVGKEVVLGIRPETISLPLEQEGPEGITSIVEGVDSLDGETYVFLNCQGNRVVAPIASPYLVEAGDEVKIHFTPNPRYLFDKETEKAILQDE